LILVKKAAHDLTYKSFVIWDAAGVSMPTQIPVKVERSYAAEAIAVSMLSLLAAVVDGTIFFIIVWAYG
jgi:hypothetical protein